jgi:Protein of unknown function (DUF3710)
VIFRRRRRSDDADEALEAAERDDIDELDTERPHGPWDRSETDADTTDPDYIDLGGLVVRGRPTLEVRLQVDEATAAVGGVLLAMPDSGLELRAFAAPRSSGIWDDVRADIAAEAGRQGGTATELDGEFGTELKVVVPVVLPDGRTATQISRIVGVDGPRWLLRGTFLGRSAEEPDPEGELESAFRDVIVVRGDAAMKPRDMLEMHMPQQVETALGEELGEGDDDD